MRYSENVPLTHKEIVRLPKGFTETSFGTTGQEIKRRARIGFLGTNRKNTAARFVQHIPIYTMVNGEKAFVRTRPVWHKKK